MKTPSFHLALASFALANAGIAAAIPQVLRNRQDSSEQAAGLCRDFECIQWVRQSAVVSTMEQPLTFDFLVPELGGT